MIKLPFNQLPKAMQRNINSIEFTLSNYPGFDTVSTGETHIICRSSNPVQATLAAENLMHDGYICDLKPANFSKHYYLTVYYKE